jgi:hypothetical protein
MPITRNDDLCLSQSPDNLPALAVRKGHHFSARGHRNGSRKAVTSAPLAPSAEWGQAALHIGHPPFNRTRKKQDRNGQCPCGPIGFEIDAPFSRAALVDLFGGDHGVGDMR